MTSFFENPRLSSDDDEEDDDDGTKGWRSRLCRPRTLCWCCRRLNSESFFQGVLVTLMTMEVMIIMTTIIVLMMMMLKRRV